MNQIYIDLEQYRSKPHPYKSIFKKYGVAITTVANFLELSYQHVYNMLSGHTPLSKYAEAQLTPLIEQLESEGKQYSPWVPIQAYAVDGLFVTAVLIAAWKVPLHE